MVLKRKSALVATLFSLCAVEISGFNSGLMMKQKLTIKSSTTATMTSNNIQRRSFMTGVAASVSAFGGMTVSSQSAFAANLPATETKAPDFELPNSRGDGKTSMKDLTKEGKWTVLYFYPGAFTSGCTLEARGFQRDMSTYKSLNTQIVGVSVDPVEKNASFCSTEGLDFYMLSDEKGTISKLYGSALSIPGFGTFSNRQTYIIDPKGTLRHVFTDVESRVARHSEEVIGKLTELQKS